MMENTGDRTESSGFLMHDDEDSVDIYDDLDITSSSNAEKPSSDSSSIKQSMDLYEEIFTEEQQSRESTYTELKSRFQAAQNQIKELHRRLEQMKLQNTSLNRENNSLKKNISALLRTARQEVIRKDAEIQRLNQWSERSHHHPSQINNQHDQNSSSWTIKSSFKSRPPPPPSCPLPPACLPPPSCPPPPLFCSPPPPPTTCPPLRERCPPREAPQPSIIESNSGPQQPSGSCDETRASTASSHSHSRSSSRGDCHDKQSEHSLRKSSSSSTRCGDLGNYKSKHRNEKHEKPCESTDRQHRSGSDPSKDYYRSHKADRDKERRHESRSYKISTCQNVEGHHRSQRTKSPAKEVLYRGASSDDKKGKSQERIQDKEKPSTPDSGYSVTHKSKERYDQDHRKTKISEGHIRSSHSKGQEKSSNPPSKCSRASSKQKEGERLLKEYQKKEDRLFEEEINSKYKRNILSDHKKLRPKESEQGKVIVKERKEKMQEALKRAPEKLRITKRSSLEENSPNRKLCFMETLNLTISPIKKLVLPISGSQKDLIAVNEAAESKPGVDSLQPDVEDVHMISEGGKELDVGCEDFAVQTRNVPLTPDSEKAVKCEGVIGVQEKDRNHLKTAAADKQFEDCSVHTTSVHSQATDNAENQMNVSLKQMSSQHTSVKAIEFSKSETRAASASECVEAMDGVSDTYGNTGKSPQKIRPGKCSYASITVAEPTVPDSSVELKCRASKPAMQKGQHMDSVKDGASASHSKTLPNEDVLKKASPQNQQSLPTSLILNHHQRFSHPASSSLDCKDACSPKDTDTVSSTISLESLPQEGLSLHEAIFVLTQTKDNDDSSSIAAEPSSSTGCITVSKVSSTTEETALPDKYKDVNFTPKKICSPGKSQDNCEPSRFTPLLHDEDSMMRTLSNLKRIPDAISPLRSPVRITRRGQLHAHGKPGHVKSLQKDFSNTVVAAESKKLDINKENKYPGSPANHDTQNFVHSISDLASSLSETELEDGEIISESEESAGSPVTATKRPKLTRSVKSKPSPQTLLKKTSEDRCVTSKESKEMAGVSTRSPKSRFKTVCPAATKVSFSSIEEVMDTFRLVRAEIRKKYMKLHKTFPKKSFYGVMNNFHESFVDFVDGAHFGEISSQEVELKSKLKKLITFVFTKVSNNGIVKRIFEQQAVNLKQRLWDFVDIQVDYLFRDVYTTLKSHSKIRTQAEDNGPSGNMKASRQPQHQHKEAQFCPPNLDRIKPSAIVPYRTGLGSRGKDIRITHMGKDRIGPPPANFSNTQTAAVHLPGNSVPLTPEKSNMSSLVVSHNGSLLDKTDFELLTEQQASSLTFNLVRDSQMGEIFKCLLQGSDLLETTGITADNTIWTSGTPRKDGEKFIGIITPTKFDSPSKLLTQAKFNTTSKLSTWSSISPHKTLSPRCKDQIPLNPALFDESCLMEVPSENRATQQSCSAAHRSYSILAEDLAVSLTIPSPLKSDSHLSFLQPSSMHIMSTPDSVISAHISEDALLDEEDATEQDIHLALDSDISSCTSSNSVASEVLATPFVFNSERPMQALVMERSNDHFIVKIRQAAISTEMPHTTDDTVTQAGDEREDRKAKAALSHTSQTCDPSVVGPSENKLSNQVESSKVSLAASGVDIHFHERDPTNTKEDISQNTSKVSYSQVSQKPYDSLKNAPKGPDYSSHNAVQSPDHSFGQMSSEGSTIIADEGEEEDVRIQESALSELDTDPQHTAENKSNETCKELTPRLLVSERGETDMSKSERSFTFTKGNQASTHSNGKRKRHPEQSKAKRFRKDEEKITKEMVSDCKKDGSPTFVSPNSLYAKNVVRKKGEVVMSWTRDEDRAILNDLKKNGASRETFSALAEKLQKPSGQVAHRFHQLMKLFRKQGKMDT